MTTIKEVASEARVSVATVSRVINNNGPVSLELRERVVNAMQKLNYSPSLVARSLRVQSTNAVAVVVPQLDEPFFSKLTFSIQQTFAEDNYYTLTCSTVEDYQVEKRTIELLLGQRVDGVIAVPTGHNAENIRRLVEGDVAVVLVDRDLPQIVNIDRVLVDNRGGGFTGMSHLLELGHRRIGVIGEPIHSGSISQRLAGVALALEEYGLKDTMLTVHTDKIEQYDIGYTAATKLLSDEQRPTALFALTDVAAAGAIHAAHDLGLRVPEDLSVVGFDDVPLASYLIPALTTIAQPIEAMGASAADLLLKRIVDPDRQNATITLETRLVERQSTARVNEA